MTNTNIETQNTSNSKAHIIVVSNEKGGTGKSTLSMHLAIDLMQEGFKVACIDLDGRQGTLTKYIENRKKFCQHNQINLAIPAIYTFAPEEDFRLIEKSREQEYDHAQHEQVRVHLAQRRDSAKAESLGVFAVKNAARHRGYRIAECN